MKNYRGFNPTLTTIAVCCLLAATSPTSAYAGENSVWGPPFVAKSIIVRLTPSAMTQLNIHEQGGIWYFGIQSLDTLNAEYGCDEIDHLSPTSSTVYQRYFYLHFTSETSPHTIASDYRADINAEASHPDFIHYTQIRPNDHWYDLLQDDYYIRMEAEEAWDLIENPDEIIMIIDGSFHQRHWDLGANLFQNPGEDADGDGHTLVMNPFQGGNPNSWLWDFDDGNLDGDDGDINDADGNDLNDKIDDLNGWDCVDEWRGARSFQDAQGNWWDLAEGEDDEVEDNNLWLHVEGEEEFISVGSHGTGVAGAASMVTNNEADENFPNGGAGTAWSCKILPTRAGVAFQRRNNPNLVTGSLHDDNIIIALEYLLLMTQEYGCPVLSCSWGSPEPAFDNQEELDDFHELFEPLINEDVIIVAAAGNSTNERVFPAAFNDIIAATATDKNDRKASFVMNASGWADVAAPGQWGAAIGIATAWYTANDGYTMRLVHGTSFSAPITAGLIALIRHVYPNIPTFRPQGEWQDNIWDRLKGSVDNLNLKGPAYYEGMLGYGRINMRRALETNPPEPNLQTYNVVVLDEANNNDGYLSAGDSDQLFLPVRNVWANAVNVTGTLSCGNELVTIIDDDHQYGNIALGAVVPENVQGLYEVMISPEFPAGETVTLQHTLLVDGAPNSVEQIVLSVTLGGPDGFPMVVGCRSFTSPALLDYDGDGVCEIVILTDDNNGGTPESVLLIEGSTGITRFEDAVTNNTSTVPAVGDVDGDFDQDIVLALFDNEPFINVYRNNRGNFTFVESRIDIADDAGERLPLDGSSPVLEDFNRDGANDILIVTLEGNDEENNEEIHVRIFDFQGNLIWRRDLARGLEFRQSGLGDINGDLVPDIVLSAHTNDVDPIFEIICLDGLNNGNVLWTINVGGEITRILIDDHIALPDARIRQHGADPVGADLLQILRRQLPEFNGH